MDTENTPIPIKIQLNSERAVRKLLDGDPELQIMVKKEIVRLIALSYMDIIKASVDTKEIVRDVEEAVRNSINEEFIEFKTAGNGYSKIPVISTKYIDVLKAGINTSVERAVREQVPNIDEEIKKRIHFLTSWAEERTEEFTTKMADKITEESIQREINLKVDERIAAIKDAL